MMEQEMEGCTFSPATNPSRSRASRISVVQHSQMWNERRDEWRAQAQENRLQEEMKECTFHPKIGLTAAQRPAYSTEPPALPGTSASNTKGFDEFVLRQEAAREARAESEVVPHCAGKNWTRQVTKPQPFNFNRTEKIRSLERPGKPEEVGKDKPPMYTMAPQQPMQFDEDGEPITQGSAAGPDGRVENRLKKFLNKYSSRRGGEEGEEEDTDGDDRQRGGEMGYYKRMAEARRIQAEKEEALNQVTGRHWKPVVTNPRAFQFHDPARSEVRSLRKPV